MASRGVNKAIILGNVGQDPEVRYMPNGDAVANVSIATSETWKDKNSGDQQERTEWHRVVFYRGLAEVVAQYVKKGSKIYVEGSLRTRSWEQDGIKRYATEIIASEMQMLDGRSERDGGNEQRNDGAGRTGGDGYARNDGGTAVRGHRTAQQQPAQNDFDDDIPF